MIRLMLNTVLRNKSINNVRQVRAELPRRLVVHVPRHADALPQVLQRASRRRRGLFRCKMVATTRRRQQRMGDVPQRAVDVVLVPAHEDAVDCALRHVAHSLLREPGSIPLQDGGDDPAPTARALEYLRKRVGVPRDMDYEAARQFRAHLTHAIDGLVA